MVYNFKRKSTNCQLKKLKKFTIVTKKYFLRKAGHISKEKHKKQMVPYASKCIHASENMLHVISDARWPLREKSGFSFEMIFLKESQDFVKSGQNMAGIFLEKIL